MRQGSNTKRPRGKSGNRGSNGGARNALTRSYDSNGPAGRVRGNPHQVHEKYLSLARDAQADDPILAENLLQHADHYFRIIAEASGNRPRHDNRRDDHGDHDDLRGDEMDGDEDRYDSRGNDDDGSSHRGNEPAAEPDSPQSDGPQSGSPQPQSPSQPAVAAQEAAPEAQAPKRTRRPRRPKTQDGKPDDDKPQNVASDAA